MSISNNHINRRQFLKYSLAGAASLDALLRSSLRNASSGSLNSQFNSFPTKIFRIDEVATYDQQIGSQAFEITGVSSIGPNPNPDDPPVAPGYHYYHQGIEDLLEKMALNGHPLWKSDQTYAPPALPLQFETSGVESDGGFGIGSGEYGGPNGLFRDDDIIIIKINAVAPAHCMVNLDVLKGLIQRIVDHPDGFTGEVIVVDKFIYDEPPNSYHLQNNVSAVCNSFPEQMVSRVIFKDLVWENKNYEQVQNGYIELEEIFPEMTWLERVSYPKFTTRYGTHIDFKLGWWNGTAYDNERVKLIGYSILKDQTWTSVTCCLKNFLGITNIGTIKFGGSDGDPDYAWQRTHEGIYQSGLLGRILRYVRFPDLFLIDATRILAQPPFGPGNYSAPFVLPGVLLAGFDPVNLDYYAAKEILLQQSVITPCHDLSEPDAPAVCPFDPSIPGYPCTPTQQCVRHDPDFFSRRRINPYYQGEEGFQIREATPLDAFRRYLEQSAKVLYGDVFIGPDYYSVM